MSEAPLTLESLLGGGLVVSPLGRRLLANTALADRRKLHEILLAFEAGGEVAQLGDRLRSMRVEPTVLVDLVRRGFLMKRDASVPRTDTAQAAVSLAPVGRRASGPGASTLHGQTLHGITRHGHTLHGQPGAARVAGEAITFDPVPLDKVLQAEKLKALEAELQKTAHNTQSLSRRAMVDNLQKLSPAATQVLAVLPPSLSLQNLLERYPRIVNQLADDWRDPARFRATMDSYLIDSRGGRQGFPLPVVNELMALRDFYNSEIHPETPGGFATATDIYRR